MDSAKCYGGKWYVIYMFQQSIYCKYGWNNLGVLLFEIAFCKTHIQNKEVLADVLHVHFCCKKNVLNHISDNLNTNWEKYLIRGEEKEDPSQKNVKINWQGVFQISFRSFSSLRTVQVSWDITSRYHLRHHEVSHQATHSPDILVFKTHKYLVLLFTHAWTNAKYQSKDNASELKDSSFQF